MENIIYQNEEFTVYKVDCFDDIVKLSHQTPWCIGEDEELYHDYASLFDIFVSCRKDGDKFCILISKKEKIVQVVDEDNIHHYKTDFDYRKIIEDKFNQDIINLFGL